MSNLPISKKRPLPDSERLEQLSAKRSHVEISKKEPHSISVRSAENGVRNYNELSKKASKQSECCKKLIEVIDICRADDNRLDWEKAHATIDLYFISNLRLLLNLIVFCDPIDKLFISDTCYNIVLLINDRCVALRRGLEAVDEFIKSGKYNKEAYREILIDGPDDRFRREKYERTKKSLIYLKNFQNTYVPFILYNSYKCLILAKITLFWNDIQDALTFFKRLTDNISDIDQGFLYDIYNILSEYKDRYPFEDSKNNDLKEYYCFIQKACGIEPIVVRSTSCNNWNQLLGLENRLEEKPIESKITATKSINPSSNGGLKRTISRAVSSLNLNQFLETENNNEHK